MQTIPYIIFLPRDARSAKRGIAIVSCPSVHLCRDLWLCWVISKVIIQIISLASSSSESQYRRSSPRGTPPTPRRIEVRSLFSAKKPAISLKRGKIGSRLQLTTNRTLRTRFQLVPKSTTLDDLELYKVYSGGAGAHYEDVAH